MTTIFLNNITFDCNKWHLKSNSTRMHSSRMRTACSLPYWGVSLTETPPGQTPPPRYGNERAVSILECILVYTLFTLLQAQNYPSIRPFPDDSSVVSQENGSLGAPDVMLHGLVQFCLFISPANDETFFPMGRSCQWWDFFRLALPYNITQNRVPTCTGKQGKMRGSFSNQGI